MARAANKPVIPIALKEGVEPPGFLRGLKYLPMYRDPHRALEWLHRNVFERAQKKKQRDGLAWLGLGAAVVWLLSEHGGRDA